MNSRVFDVVCSLVGLILLTPFFLVLILLIKLDSAGPAFFRQMRVGQYGNPFRIVKFRTMVAQSESAGPKITRAGDSRITKLGRVLRKYKLDELPQLINVLLGDMSLVGPRPEVPEYIQYYTAKQREILDVKPGITSYASLLFKTEEQSLRDVNNVEEIYIKETLPKKLDIELLHISRNSSVVTKLRLIVQTLYGIFSE